MTTANGILDNSAMAEIGRLLVNPRGLRRLAIGLSNADITPYRIDHNGDSRIFEQGVGNTAGTTDTQGDTGGGIGLQRRLWAREFGTQEAGVIPANDDRVVVGGTNLQSIPWIGPGGLAKTVTSAQSLGFPVPRGTSLSLEYWEHNGTNGLLDTGGLSYTLDGGAVVNVAKGSGVNLLKSVTFSASDAAHNVVVTGLSASNAAVICGIVYHSGKGVIVGRYGRKGWTSADLTGSGANNNLGASTKAVLMSTLAGVPGVSSCLAILCDYNDMAQQLAANQLTTPDKFEANLRLWVASRIANNGCALLIQGCPSAIAPPSGGAILSEYYARMEKIALDTDHVACFKSSALFGTAADITANGLYWSDPHPNTNGYPYWHRSIFGAISSKVIPLI